MPRHHSPEVRRQVIELARAGTKVKQLAMTFAISEATIYSSVKQDRIDRGEAEGATTGQQLEHAAARRRIRQLETELAVARKVNEVFRRTAISSRRRQRVRSVRRSGSRRRPPHRRPHPTSRLERLARAVRWRLPGLVRRASRSCSFVVVDGGERVRPSSERRPARRTGRPRSSHGAEPRSWRARPSGCGPGRSSAPVKTIVACVPDWAEKRCSSRSWAFWDSMPGTVKSSLKLLPAARRRQMIATDGEHDGEGGGAWPPTHEECDAGEERGHCEHAPAGVADPLARRCNVAPTLRQPARRTMRPMTTLMDLKHAHRATWAAVTTPPSRSTSTRCRRATCSTASPSRRETTSTSPPARATWPCARPPPALASSAWTSPRSCSSPARRRAAEYRVTVDWIEGGRGGAAVRRRHLRPCPVRVRRPVRPAARRGGGRAGARVPPRRRHRARQLDARPA